MLVGMNELREKVIRGLECVICPTKFCGDCSYFIRNENNPDTGWCNRDAIYKDALSLLKAQEQEIQQLKATHIFASGNAIACGVIRGGVTINQKAKEITNIKHVEVFNW